MVLISQIDRAFDLSDESLPGPEHIRLPNPMDLTQFTKLCFIHEGQVAVTAGV